MFNQVIYSDQAFAERMQNFIEIMPTLSSKINNQQTRQFCSAPYLYSILELLSVLHPGRDFRIEHENFYYLLKHMLTSDWRQILTAITSNAISNLSYLECLLRNPNRSINWLGLLIVAAAITRIEAGSATNSICNYPIFLNKFKQALSRFPDNQDRNIHQFQMGLLKMVKHYLDPNTNESQLTIRNTWRPRPLPSLITYRLLNCTSIEREISSLYSDVFNFKVTNNLNNYKLSIFKAGETTTDYISSSSEEKEDDNSLSYSEL